MKPTEAAALLTIAAAYDNRKPDADQAKAWAMALDGLRFEDCREVVVAHYQRSREWLMPVDVISGVKRLRAKRLHDHPPVDPPSWLDPDDTAALITWKRQTDNAIADGTCQPPAPQALAKRDMRELAGPNSVDAALATKPIREAHAEAKRALREAEDARRAKKDAQRQARAEAMAADEAARQALNPNQEDAA